MDVPHGRPFFPQFDGDWAYGAEKVYSIQIGSFKSLKVAENKVKHLNRLGHNAFYRHEAIKGRGKWYRVYIERFSSRRAAVKEAGILKKLGLISDYAVRAIDAAGKTGPDSKSASLDKRVFFIHVGSFKGELNAENKVQQLKNLGYKAFQVGEDVSGKRWFRVYIGEFDNEGEAQKVGALLRERKIIAYFKALAIEKGALFPSNVQGK